jgi:hypothetical protein
MYIGAQVDQELPRGTVLLRWPSGTLQRIDDVGPGTLEPVEPITVEVQQDSAGATLRFLPVDVWGQAQPLQSFDSATVTAVGVPVQVVATLGADGAGEITVTAPTSTELDAWTASQTWSTGSTQLRIEGTDFRPRLFW